MSREERYTSRQGLTSAKTYKIAARLANFNVNDHYRKPFPMLKITGRFGVGIAVVSQWRKKQDVLSSHMQQGQLASLAKLGPLGNLFEL